MGLTAEAVKDALRRRHPVYEPGYQGVGRWTCIEEWAGIDLLALDAWRSAAVVGYEVKVSRGDMRTELLRPHKRAAGVAMCTRFYFAVPKGLLTADELAFQEPLDVDHSWFERERCPGIPLFGPDNRVTGKIWGRFGGQCQGTRRRRKFVQPYTIAVPKPAVIDVPDWVDSETKLEWHLGRLFDAQALERIPCPACNGKGYVAKSYVEREFPTLWVPNDVGLVEVEDIDRGHVRMVREAPSNPKPRPLVPEITVRPWPARDQEQSEIIQNQLNRQALANLIRWVSARPDPRHVQRGSNR
jgi:hypothetical protein